MSTNARPLISESAPQRHDLASLCTPTPVAGPDGTAVDLAAAALARSTPFVRRQLRVALHAAVANGVPLADATDALERFGPYHLVDALSRLPNAPPGSIAANGVGRPG